MRSEGATTRSRARAAQSQGVTLGRAHAGSARSRDTSSRTCTRPAQLQGVTTRSQARASWSGGMTTRNQARSMASAGATFRRAEGLHFGLTSAQEKNMIRELKKIDAYNPDAPCQSLPRRQRLHHNVSSREVAPLAGISAQPAVAVGLGETSTERTSKRKRTDPGHLNATSSNVLYFRGRPDLSSVPRR